LLAAGKLNCHVLFHVASLLSFSIQLSFGRVIRQAGAKKRSPVDDYLAAKELHWYKSIRVAHSSEPQTAKKTPATVIVSNSTRMVLRDLARMLQPTRNGLCVLP
jgi:hypothetical protein